MILHSQDKPFKCTYCEEHFKSRFARLKHQEKFHLGEQTAFSRSGAAGGGHRVQGSLLLSHHRGGGRGGGGAWHVLQFPETRKYVCLFIALVTDVSVVLGHIDAPWIPVVGGRKPA